MIETILIILRHLLEGVQYGTSTAMFLFPALAYYEHVRKEKDKYWKAEGRRYVLIYTSFLVAIFLGLTVLLWVF